MQIAIVIIFEALQEFIRRPSFRSLLPPP